METDFATRIAALPQYQELKARRSRFGWYLTLAMMLVYYGFILLVDCLHDHHHGRLRTAC